MNRSLLMGLLIFFAVIGISLVGDQPQAQGGWWHRANCGWGGYGYYGCGGCYGYAAPVGCFGWGGGYGCGGYGYACGGYACGGYGWGGGYACGGYGYTGCGGGGYTYAADCCGVVGGTVVEGKVMGDATQKDGPVMDQPTPAEQEQDAQPEAAQPATGTSTFFNLRVPENAKVVINGHETSSTGAERRYVSRGLKPNLEYQFEIRAEVQRDGATVERTKVVRVKASQNTDLTFDFEAPQIASASR